MVELTTDQIITIGVALVTGIGSSFATLIASQRREDKKENEAAKRVRALIIVELETVRNHLQHWLDASRSGGEIIPLLTTSAEVEYNEYIINNLQYLSLDVNLKLKAFKPDELRELHRVYTQIKTMKMFRIAGRVGDTGYTKVIAK